MILSSIPPLFSFSCQAHGQDLEFTYSKSRGRVFFSFKFSYYWILAFVMKAELLKLSLRGRSNNTGYCSCPLRHQCHLTKTQECSYWQICSGIWKIIFRISCILLAIWLNMNILWYHIATLVSDNIVRKYNMKWPHKIIKDLVEFNFHALALRSLSL